MDKIFTGMTEKDPTKKKFKAYGKNGYNNKQTDGMRGGIAYFPNPGDPKSAEKFNNRVSDSFGAGCSTDTSSSGGTSSTGDCAAGGCGESYNENTNGEILQEDNGSWFDSHDLTQQQKMYKDEIDRIYDILIQEIGQREPYDVISGCQVDIQDKFTSSKDFWNALDNKLKSNNIDYETVDQKDWSDIKDMFSSYGNENVDVSPFSSYILNVWLFTDEEPENNDVQQEEQEFPEDDSDDSDLDYMDDQSIGDVEGVDELSPEESEEEEDWDNVQDMPESLQRIAETFERKEDTKSYKYKVVDESGNIVKYTDSSAEAVNLAKKFGNATVYEQDGENSQVYYDASEEVENNSFGDDDSFTDDTSELESFMRK